ncbi:alpha-hydroxy-acid oxidizing protein [Acuticoccus sp. M5D2P5]|uniref:alpha-hydroxy acid oxidase n=1 Tax=Acuticoccus kalidii TaxID=2910977 RepID=UPI001F1598F9|nr:alpha-hydroxy acid oxidase [Acuticoccus kalidii]MCF3931908.1 alpha-hydroxy-acid oxidizing protein [Acuticoccus kalidii]
MAADLSRVASVDAMRERARRVLPRAVFDFADGGAETETTLRRNEAAFRALSLLPRPLRGAGTRNLSRTLFGHTLSMPLVVGPTGLAGLFWPDGECEAARAASAAGVGICLSHGSACTLEHFADAGAVPRWMQVFIYTDRGFTRELAMRAKAAGYHALVLTIDNQLTGNRERDLRNGFTIPPRPGFAGLADTVTKAGWLWRMRRELRSITFANYRREGEADDIGALAGRMGALLDPGMTWRDVEWLRTVWDGPLILKGVMHPDDVEPALGAGVDGIVVSNHGGRQLDGAAASVEALPAIAKRVGGRMPVLLDGGVRRGGDILKALALGADAVLIGRPQLWGIAVAGEAGLARVLDIYRGELDRAMGLCGLSSLGEIDASILHTKPKLFREGNST